MYDADAQRTIGYEKTWIINLLVYTLLGIIALLFFILAQNARAIRIKNNILHKASKNIKTVAGQLLTRKAAINAIEQRYFTELPELNINDIHNPGYDGH